MADTMHSAAPDTTTAELDLSPETVAQEVENLRAHADERQRNGWLTSAHNLRIAAAYMEALSAQRTRPPASDADVERVAKAIYEADDVWHAAFPWPNLPEIGMAEGYRVAARAAILALGGRHG